MDISNKTDFRGPNALAALAAAKEGRTLIIDTDQVCKDCGSKFRFNREVSFCPKCHTKHVKEMKFRRYLMSSVMPHIEEVGSKPKTLLRANISRVQKAIREGEKDVQNLINLVFVSKEYNNAKARGRRRAKVDVTA